MNFRHLVSAICLIIVSGCIGDTTNYSGNPRSEFPWGGGGQQTAQNTQSPYGGFSVSGNDQYYNAAALGPDAPERAIVIPEEGDRVQLNLVNASIAAAANAVLRDTLGQNFNIADDVTGKITLQTTGRISKSALFSLFEDALAINNARIENQNGQIRIVRADGISRAFRSAGADAQAAIIVAPLNYVSPQSMLSVLQPVIDEGLWVKAETTHNLILFAGSPSNVNSAMEALNIFDVDVLAGKSIALIPIQSAEPIGLVAELESIFESNEGGRLEGSIEFVPNPGSRSILVIATRRALLSDARTWIGQLDTAARESGSYVEIYPLNFRDAAEIAPILTSLMASGAVSESSENGANQPDGPRISADIPRNGIVVRARNREHEEIGKLLARLDTSARQVLLEATIAEVTLNDNLSHGVRWFFQNGAFSTALSDQTSGSVGADFPGFSAVFSGLNAQVAINALSSVTDVQIISSPTIMVVENHSATLRFGDQVPVATQNSAGSNDETTVTTIEYRDTGVILEVTPRIGANGNVTLHIRQEVSDVVTTTTSGIDSPTIRQRQIETVVTVANGATLTLGGLVQEQGSNSNNGIPGLNRLRGIGGLFGNRNRRIARTELLILIRPLVVNNASEAARVTAYWRDQLSGANGIYTSGVTQPTHLLPGG